MNTTQIFEFQKINLSFESVLNHPDFSHARFDPPWDCFVGTDSPYRFGTLKLYLRCSDSPSGVLLVSGFVATPEKKKLLADKNLRANVGPSRGEIAMARGVSTIGF